MWDRFTPSESNACLYTFSGIAAAIQFKTPLF